MTNKRAWKSILRSLINNSNPKGPGYPGIETDSQED